RGRSRHGKRSTTQQSREEETEKGEAEGDAGRVTVLEAEHERHAEAGRRENLASEPIQNGGKPGERALDCPLDLGRRTARWCDHLLQAAHKSCREEGGATVIDRRHVKAHEQVARPF